jgi:hypothetical protein
LSATATSAREVSITAKTGEKKLPQASAKLGRVALQVFFAHIRSVPIFLLLVVFFVMIFLLVVILSEMMTLLFLQLLLLRLVCFKCRILFGIR